MHKAVLLSVLLGISSHHSVAKWEGRTWQSNVNFNNSANWEAGREPCAADRLVLQSTDSIVLEIPEGKTPVRALVLPSYMELVLPRVGNVTFTGKTNAPGCEGQDMVFKPTRAGRWTDADNWDGWTEATPDLERIPCMSDPVRFPAGGFYKVLMPQSVAVGSLEVNGVNMDSADWFVYMEGEGRRQFFRSDKSPADVQVSGITCEPNQWCSCRNEYLRYEICTTECPITLCKTPVKPVGFCCPVCGVYFLLDTKSKWDQKPLLTNQIKNYLSDKEDIAWHSSRVGDLIQVVLVEKGDYSGKIPDIGEELKTSLGNSKMNWVTREFHASGHVWYPATFGQIITHFFSLLVFAALIIASILTFYSQNWTWIRFPTLESRPFVFARFENQSGEGEVVVASEPPLEPAAFPENNTFDNPMYGATTQELRKVTVENPVFAEVVESTNEDFQTHNLASKSDEPIEE